MNTDHSDSDTDVINTHPVFWKVIKSGRCSPSEIRILFNTEDRRDSMANQPLNWINWLSLNFDEKNNSVNFNISTQDPRRSQLNIQVSSDQDEHTQQSLMLNMDGDSKNLYSINSQNVHTFTNEIQRLTTELEQKNQYIQALEKLLNDLRN